MHGSMLYSHRCIPPLTFISAFALFNTEEGREGRSTRRKRENEGGMKGGKGRKTEIRKRRMNGIKDVVKKGMLASKG